MTTASVETQSPSRWGSIKTALLNFLLVKKGEEGFRTFHGVFLPSMLSILGVILYLRLSWIIGEMGLISTISIICLATSITLITSFSISASSTNMHVGNGGVYFIISRSLGATIGSAIGIPLYCAQAIGIAFFIMGFAETMHYMFPALDLNLIEFSSLAALGLISLISTSFILRAQFFIFIIIVLSLASFFFGVEITDFTPSDTPITRSLGYWAAFAIFFPAVTGLEAGVSMSGELKNPRRSLPLGTITAVVIGFVIYLTVAYVLWARVPDDLLVSNPMIMQTVAWSGSLILMGIIGATVSSALGAILAAPRTLQAISNDGIVPKFIGKEFGKGAEPRVASFITLAIVALCLYLGDLNYIAPIMTMFFLISYGMLNLAAGLEGLMNNPSWRPTIAVPASVSLIGAFICIATMLLIDASYTFMAIFLVMAIYMIMKRRLIGEYDDIRQGVMLYFLRKAVYALADSAVSVRSWRPNVLAFTQNLTPCASILDFTSGITGRKGFLTLVHCFSGDEENFNLDKLTSMIKQTLLGKKIEALVEVISAADFLHSFKNMLASYGLNPLRPNTIIIKIDDNNLDANEIAEITKATYAANKNLVFLASNNNQVREDAKTIHIDIWWDEELRDSNDLMTVLAHMYANSNLNKNAKINLNSIVKDEISRERRLSHITTLLAKNRLDIAPHVYVSSKPDDYNLISQFSNDNGMVFIGMRPIEPEESAESYSDYLKAILHKLKRHKVVGLFLASEKIELGID